MSKIVDIKGQRFGKLLVEYYVGNNKHGKAIWRCLCDCGEKVEILSNSLKSGHNVTCGKCPCYIDIINKKFNYLTAQSYIKKENKWICVCDCGKTRKANYYDLSNNKIISCGCHILKPILNKIGKKYQNLTIKEYLGKNNLNKSIVRCLCDCGNYTDVVLSALTGGYIKSCGCFYKPDYTGKVIGKLTVECEDGQDRYKNRLWKCKCVCGRERHINTKNITEESIVNCGKCEIKYENLIGKVFDLWEVKEFAGRNANDHIQWKCQCLCQNKTEKLITSNVLKQGGSKHCGCRYDREQGIVGFKKLKAEYIRRGHDNKKGFYLTDDEFKFLTKQNCFYCNKEPSSISKAKRPEGIYIYNGIDRVKNDIGYTLENSVTCCIRCNKMKIHMSYEEFVSIIQKIDNNIFIQDKPKEPINNLWLKKKNQ